MNSQASNSSRPVNESGNYVLPQASFGPSASPDPKETAFFDWMKKGGAYFPDVEIKEVDGCRGMYSKRAIKEGEVFLRVPLDLCLFNNDEEYDFLSNSLGDWSNLYNYMPIVGRLMFEQMDPRSRWRSYLDVLPSRVPSNVSGYIDPHKDLLVRSAAWNDFQEFTSDYSDEWNHLSGLDNDLNQFSKTQLYWAREIYFSRAFRGHCFGWEEKVLFIPLIDMCNHVYDSCMSLRYSEESNSFEGVADRNIAADEEITFYYGDHTNAYFLILYGFTFPDNPLKVLRLPFKDYLTEHSIRHLGSSKYIDALFTVHNKSNDSFYKMLSQLRAFVRDGAKTVGEELTPYNEVGSADEERAVHTLLLELCERRLEQLPEGLERRLMALTEEGMPTIDHFNLYNLMNVYNDEAFLLRELRDHARHLLKVLNAQKEEGSGSEELPALEDNLFWSLYAAQLRRAASSGPGRHKPH